VRGGEGAADVARARRRGECRARGRVRRGVRPAPPHGRVLPEGDVATLVTLILGFLSVLSLGYLGFIEDFGPQRTIKNNIKSGTIQIFCKFNPNAV